MKEEQSSLSEPQELFEHHRFIVDKGQTPLRIDKYLLLKLAHTSRTKIQNAAEGGNILLNGKTTRASYKVKPLDEITILLPHPPKNFEIIAEDLPIDILYEDDDILIVNKSAGMVVHPAFGHDRGTLVNVLHFHFSNLPVGVSKVAEGIYAPRPGLVHRIDKNTTGILIVAKHEFALQKLARKFYDHDLERKYLAIVWGTPNPLQGTIRFNIGRSIKDRKVMESFPEGGNGKRAITHYKLLENFGLVSLLECKLETGRTHQIRAHLKAMGTPVFNDEQYGGNIIKKGNLTASYKQFIQNCFEICGRQALHAASLKIEHPVTGEIMLFKCDLPSDMNDLLTKWRKYSHGKAQG